MADMSVTSQSPPSPGLGTNKFRTSVGDADISIEIGQVLLGGSGEFNGAIYAGAAAPEGGNVSGIATSASERGGFRGGHVDVQFVGLLDLPTAVWDARHGFTGGLTPGAVYYLSETAGRMTATPPVTIGAFVTPIGFALNAETLQIQLGLAVVNVSP
jgi:hypothetical protein